MIIINVATPTTNLILNQGSSQKYNYNENIHVDNNVITIVEIVREIKGITVNNEDGKDEFSIFLHTSTLVHSLSSSVISSFHIVGPTIEKMLSYSDLLTEKKVYILEYINLKYIW